MTSTLLRNCTAHIDLNIVDDKGNTVLHYACRRGATICVLTLLKEGSDLEPKNDLGNTPFAIALQSLHSDLGAFLINKNCEPNTLIWKEVPIANAP